MSKLIFYVCSLFIIYSLWHLQGVKLIETSLDTPTVHLNSSTNVYTNPEPIEDRLKRSSNWRLNDRRRYMNSNCRKTDFNVNFTELGWEKFIIYPKVFNAYLCSGSCMLPFKRSMLQNRVATTNHAQIMSILEYKNPIGNREMTKCVSTKLKPLTVIFIDEKGLIRTKVYQDMIVDRCGCR